MSDFIRVRQDDGVTRISVERPDTGNLISDAMAVELADMIDTAGKTSRYIVFRTAGEDFCLGRDRAGRTGPGPREALDARDENEVVFHFYNAFRRSPAPVVVPVQGRALGFGCAIANVADVTIASDRARFGFPEMGHNIMPTMAMSSGVDRMMRKALTYMIYATEEVDAHTALAYGVVSRVVPHGELEAALGAFTGALDKAPLPALRAVKEFGRHAMTMDVHAATDFARNLHAVINTAARMRPNR